MKNNEIEICKLPAGFVMTRENIAVINQLVFDKIFYGQCAYHIKNGDIIRIPPED